MRMKTLILSFFGLFFVLQTNLYAGNNYSYNRIDALQDASPVYIFTANTNPVPVPFRTIELAGAFTVDSITVGPEILTTLTGFYDYKTNGETNHYIQVDPLNPLNIHAIDVQADSTDFTGATTRRSKYAVSSDGGTTWLYLTDVPPSIKSGFSTLILKDGAAVIANHKVYTTALTDANLFLDAAPEFGSFTNYEFASHAPWGIWPQITKPGNGNILMIDRRNTGSVQPQETLYVNIFNGITMLPRTPVFLTQNPMVGTIGSNMKYHISSSGANVTIVADPVQENDTLGSARTFAINSTDNGATWGATSVIFSPYISGADTIGSVGGSDMIYKPGTNTWFYTYLETKLVGGFGSYAEAKLKIRKSDGTSTVLTDVPSVEATTSFTKPMAFVFNIDNPGLGWSSDNKALYCTYSVVKADTGASGFNERDLYFQYSFNDGASWSTPVRLTNTTNIDETYPSISVWNKGNSSTGESYELNMVYMKDPGVGPSSFNGTSPTAPSSRNYLVYRKINFSAPIGIHNPSSTAYKFSLEQNYPNPFNPSTVIYYSLPKQQFVSIMVYDVLGREVKTLVHGVQGAGVKSINFNAENLTSGIYFYTIRTGDYTDTKKMMLIK